MIGALLAGTIYPILFIVKFFLDAIIALVAGLINIIINLNGFVNIPIVQAGWAITLSFTNSFFGLILLVIAFGIILGIEKFGTKQLVIDLIISILLINFSLAIAGAAIDFSQVLTQQFLSPLNQYGGISESLLGASKIVIVNKPADVNSSSWQKAKELAKDITLGPISLTTDILFTDIFLLVITFALLAMVITLFYRIVMLWILLILSPIVWACRILPSTKEYWDKWWGEFWKWTLFAPSYSFFIYIAVLMASSDSMGALLGDKNLNPAANIFLSAFASSAAAIMQFVALIIILLAGLVLSTQAGHASMKLGKGLAAKFTGLKAGGRYLSAIKEQFKKKDRGRQHAVEKRVGNWSKKNWSPLAIARTQKQTGERRESMAKKKLDEAFNDKKYAGLSNQEKTDAIRKDFQEKVGGWGKRLTPFGRESASVHAIALAELHKGRKLETGEVDHVLNKETGNIDEVKKTKLFTPTAPLDDGKKGLWGWGSTQAEKIKKRNKSYTDAQHERMHEDSRTEKIKKLIDEEAAEKAGSGHGDKNKPEHPPAAGGGGGGGGGGGDQKPPHQ